MECVKGVCGLGEGELNVEEVFFFLFSFFFFLFYCFISLCLTLYN
jgi:hypothetical protein